MLKTGVTYYSEYSCSSGMKRLLSVVLALFAFVPVSFAQVQNIRVMQYNLMYYTEQTIYDCSPSTNNLATKDAAFKTIVDYVLPDVITVNEIGSNVSYADRIVNNVLNTNGRDYYRHSVLTNYSGGSIANMLFYNSQKLAFYSHFYIATVNRDINGYKMYYITPNLANGDTVFTTFILAHLKAGSDASNVQKRYSQVVQLMAKIHSMGGYENYCLSGDFNLYGASESAYQHLINYGNNMYKFYDPINREGEWNNNYSFRDIHTQSTHADNSNACFSSGGLDDRFDFILVSPAVYYGSRKVSIVSNSYHAVGQDGNHFNKSINFLENDEVPSAVANALYNMSDHLPVVMDLAVDITPLSISEQADFLVRVVNPVVNQLDVDIQVAQEGRYYFEIYSADGRLLSKYVYGVSTGVQHISIDFPYASGLYILLIHDEHNGRIIKKLIK